ncbi:hypothetical protein AB0H00_16215 [Nocardia sp. NPDC023852]
MHTAQVRDDAKVQRTSAVWDAKVIATGKPWFMYLCPGRGRAALRAAGMG